jgi:hypothetical protein
MRNPLKSSLIPSVLVTSFAGASLLSIQPAVAEPNWVRDIGVGAAGSTVTGAVSGNGSVVGNAAQGAAAGAAVSGVRRAFGTKGQNALYGIPRDAAVGAAASVVTGKVVRNGSVGQNAVKGAVSGTAVNVLSR